MFYYGTHADAQDAQTSVQDFALPRTRPELSDGIYVRYGKRALDLTLVILSAPFVLVILGICALLIRRDGGPAFYSQPRIGKDGKHFTCWKLRTMVVNSEEALANHLAANPTAKAEWDVSQKLRNDPRITRLGQFLRKSSIDELPQFWCILLGDMSLIGPRPFMPEQEHLYKGRAYYALRPGLTGFWQVGDRNESSFAARAVFDNRYGAEVSLATDVKLLFQTVQVVAKGTGC